jgi:hypothetical protein
MRKCILRLNEDVSGVDGAMTISIATFRITTLIITTPSTIRFVYETFNVMIISILSLISTISTNNSSA